MCHAVEIKIKTGIKLSKLILIVSVRKLTFYYIQIQILEYPESLRDPRLDPGGDSLVNIVVFRKLRRFYTSEVIMSVTLYTTTVTTNREVCASSIIIDLISIIKRVLYLLFVTN